MYFTPFDKYLKGKISTMTNPTVTDSNGNLVSINIELFESSGPVSPAYQYNLNLNLKSEGNNLHLKYSHKGKYVSGVPEKNVAIDEMIPKDKAIKLISLLLDLNPLGINVDLPENIKNNVGISFNELNLQIGSNEKTKILYTLSDLKKSEFENQSKIIQFLKNVENWKEI